MSDEKSMEELAEENARLRESNQKLLEQLGGLSVDYGIPADGRAVLEALRQSDNVKSFGVLSLDKVKTLTIMSKRDKDGGVAIALVDPGGDGITFTEALSTLFFGTAHLAHQQGMDLMALADTARGFFRGVSNYISKPPAEDQN